jgi:hypothetical protein
MKWKCPAMAKRWQMTKPEINNPSLFSEVKELILSAKNRAVVAVNAELTLLCRQVGKRIATEILAGERAEYGRQIIDSLADKLTNDFGKGWGAKKLRHCVRFAEVFPEETIFYALRIKLGFPKLSLVHHKRIFMFKWLSATSRL